MLNICEYSMEVEGVKMALGTLRYRELEVQPVVRRSVEFLIMQYEISNEEKYLENAFIIIGAYLLMGSIYETEKELFDQVLSYLNATKEDVFPAYYFTAKMVKLSKYQIRKMIGKWMPSKENPMKIGEVVGDIMDKIQNKKKGHYYYKYVNNANGTSGITGMYLYELVVSDKECFFYDVKGTKYYRFY